MRMDDRFKDEPWWGKGDLQDLEDLLRVEENLVFWLETNSRLFEEIETPKHLFAAMMLRLTALILGNEDQEGLDRWAYKVMSFYLTRKEEQEEDDLDAMLIDEALKNRRNKNDKADDGEVP